MKIKSLFLLAATCAFFSIFLISPADAAIINVTTNLDEFADGPPDGCAQETGACSLREAIEAANRQNGVDFGGCPGTNDTENTIVLQGLTYTLTCTGSGEDDNNSGDLDISTNMRIEGIPGETVVDASGLEPVIVGEAQPDRVFHIVPQLEPCGAACSTGLPEIMGNGVFATVTLFGMQITNGNPSNMNKYTGEVDASCGCQNGGGILNHGFLTVQQVEVVGNEACNGGGIANEPFLEPYLMGESVGGAGFDFTVALTVLESQINTNIASDNGGGIYSTVVNQIIRGGDSVDGSGDEFVALAIEDSLIQDNAATFGSGGGIYLLFSIFSMDESTVNNNTAADHGGGIAGDFIRLCPQCETSTGGAGAAGLESFLWTEISNSTVSRNDIVQPLEDIQGEFEGVGGGIAYLGGTHTVNNSTISNNTALFQGGGFYFDLPMILSVGSATSVEGAGDFSFPNRVTLFNVTIAENTVGALAAPVATGMLAGGGIYHVPHELCSTGGDADCEEIPPPAVTIYNSLIARNQAPTGPDCFSALQSGGFNLIGDATDCTITDATPLMATSASDDVSAQAQGDQFGGGGNAVINPEIGPLQPNGGPTETHALAADSPAVDTANNVEGCQAIEVDAQGIASFIVLDRDQRDSPRPVAVKNPNQPICDIGAFELLIFDFAVTKVDHLEGDAELGQEFDWTITVTNTGVNPAPNVILTDPLPLGCNVFGVIFDSVQTDHGSCSEAGGTVSCNLGTLNSGESAVVTISVTTCGPVADGERHAIENIVTVTAGDLDFLGFITKTAQDDTSIRGVFAFGSGCGSNLNPSGPVAPGHKVIYAAAGMVLTASLLGWRRRAKQRR